MGDVLIVGRGGGGSSSSKYELKTEIYEADKLWVVPKAKDQKFSVRIFGGGAGSYRPSSSRAPGGWAGGGGFMNNGDLTLSEGSAVQITIGSGGKANGNGGSVAGGVTSFGTYLAANGAGAIYTTNWDARYIGACGASGGGGMYNTYGGIGVQFGGGGSGTHRDYGYDARGGDGGYYGGGGGGISPISTSDNLYHSPNFCQMGGKSINYVYNPSNGYWYNGGGGGLGGNGGGAYSNRGYNTTVVMPEDGTNTSTNTQLNESVRGFGKAGTWTSFNSNIIGCGGGGGYGGNGGNSCGGGGGYGADGGDGVKNGGGGGGGYGKGGHGGNGYENIPGGGGSYGPGGEKDHLDGQYGGGGAGGVIGGNGGNGICIIQYYA